MGLLYKVKKGGLWANNFENHKIMSKYKAFIYPFCPEKDSELQENQP